MRNKLWIVTLLIFTMIFTGCSATQLELWEKNKATVDWEATQVDMEMTMKVSMGEEVPPQEIYMTMTGYTNTKDLDGYIKFSMKDATGMIAVEDIEMYIKDAKTYIARSYIEEMEALSGQSFPEGLLEADTQFICFTDEQMQQQMDVIYALINNSDIQTQVFSLYEDVAKITELDIPVEKNGNTYSIKLDQTQLVNLVKNIMVKGTEKLPEINEMIGLGLTEEEIKVAQEEMALIKPEMDQLCTMVASMFTGNVEMDLTFNKDVLDQTLKMNIHDPLLTGMDISVDAKVKSKKIPAKVVTIPGKVQTITMEQIEKATFEAMPKSVFIDLEYKTMLDDSWNEIPCKTMSQDGQTFVECKVVLGGLGKEVIYNKEVQKVGIKGEKFVPLNVVTKDGVSYISLEELTQLGYHVEADAYSIYIAE